MLDSAWIWMDEGWILGRPLASKNGWRVKGMMRLSHETKEAMFLWTGTRI